MFDRLDPNVIVLLPNLIDLQYNVIARGNNNRDIGHRRCIKAESQIVTTRARCMIGKTFSTGTTPYYLRDPATVMSFLLLCMR